MVGNFIFLTVVEVATVPLFIIMFNLSIQGSISLFIGSILLSNIAICTIGTLLSTISINTKMRDMLLPLIFLPVIFPALASAVISTSRIMSGATGDEFALAMSAMKLLVAYDIIFLLVAYALYDFVIGE
jgi:heme exporter protein B